MLTINQQRTVKVPVTVLSMRWCGELKECSVATGFKCSACGHRLGERRFAVAFIRKESGVEYSMRLCADCGIKAENSIGGVKCKSANTK